MIGTTPVAKNLDPAPVNSSAWTGAMSICLIAFREPLAEHSSRMHTEREAVRKPLKVNGRHKQQRLDEIAHGG